MTIHKLTAGSGYDYLTRQVAAQDATERGHSGLASYYSARGEAPGVWVGRGLSGLEGLAAGDVVTEEQMRNLFGSGATHWPSNFGRRPPRPGWMRQLRTGRAGSGTSTRCTPTTSRSSAGVWPREWRTPTWAAACGGMPKAPLRTAPGSAPRSLSSCSGRSFTGTRSTPARSPATDRHGTLVPQNERGRRL
jgi:hypothetical protein